MLGRRTKFKKEIEQSRDELGKYTTARRTPQTASATISPYVSMETTLSPSCSSSNFYTFTLPIHSISISYIYRIRYRIESSTTITFTLQYILIDGLIKFEVKPAFFYTRCSF